MVEPLASEVPEEQCEVFLGQVAEVWTVGNKLASEDKSGQRESWNCQGEPSSWWDRETEEMSGEKLKLAAPQILDLGKKPFHTDSMSYRVLVGRVE